MSSPYPWYYTLLWPYFYHWPSTKQHISFVKHPLKKRFLSQTNTECSILFCGDIMVLQKDVVPFFSKSLSELMSKQDLIIGNCEAPVGKHAPNPQKKYHLTFNMPQTNLEKILRNSGAPLNKWVLNIANNHSYDQGYLASLKTVHHIRELGCTPIGQLDIYSNPMVTINVADHQIGLVAWTHWMNKKLSGKKEAVNRTKDILREDWCAIKKQHNIHFLTALPHWDYEFQHCPAKATQKLAKMLIEKHKFDFILGSHPHTLQPMEHFSAGICQYSLGNFLGLGIAWPVKLIPLLEIRLQKVHTNQSIITAYQFHFYVQKHEKNDIHIVPLSDIPTPLQLKMKNRISLLFSEEGDKSS